MAIFCTRCGTKNEAGAAFCENCGNPLRAPQPVAPPLQDMAPTVNASGARGATSSGQTSASSERGVKPKSKKLLYASLALAAILLVGGGAMYLVLQAPSPTPANLLAAAKAGYDKSSLDRERNGLCLSNTDYRNQQLNVGEQDQRFRSLMDALVAAGLYSAPVPVTSGGFFQQTLLQYVPTPELAKYREGSRLCLAKGVEIVEVSDIGEPFAESGSMKGKQVSVTGVRGQVILQAVDLAPWMGSPAVSNVLMERVADWAYKDKKLQQQRTENFALVDKRWAAGPNIAAMLEKSARSGQYSDKDAARKSARRDDTAEEKPGLASKLAGLFSFGGHPLKGTWRSMAIKQDGIALPAGLAPDITFTADSMESGGASTKCDFEVDGTRVKVTPKGQSQSLIFVMESKDVMVASVLNFRYQRIK